MHMQYMLAMNHIMFLLLNHGKVARHQFDLGLEGADRSLVRYHGTAYERNRGYLLRCRSIFVRVVCSVIE